MDKTNYPNLLISKELKEIKETLQRIASALECLSKPKVFNQVNVCPEQMSQYEISKQVKDNSQ